VKSKNHYYLFLNISAFTHLREIPYVEQYILLIIGATGECEYLFTLPGDFTLCAKRPWNSLRIRVHYPAESLAACKL
ncbi:MAG: hypothetical protein V2I46_01485, partial [Bacteroides sp.]|nr:hypothetical protein [Bacteroides sp.]